jgi:hypothetical protein
LDSSGREREGPGGVTVLAEGQVASRVVSEPEVVGVLFVQVAERSRHNAAQEREAIT